MYLYGFFAWWGTFSILPGVVRCVPRPRVGPLLPSIEHRSSDIRVADLWLWPLWLGRTGVVLVGRHGMRHYAGPFGLRPSANWDIEALSTVLAGNGFVLKG